MRLNLYICLLFMSLNVCGREVIVESQGNNGQLVFNEIPNAEYYRVEWSPTSIGPWTNSWEALCDIGKPGNGSITCSVAICYRVIAEVRPEGMIWIPAGTNSGIDPDYGAYSLSTDGFYMDTTEITKAKWDEVFNWGITNGYGFSYGDGKDADHPVQGISWYDCVKWCNARSEMEGRTPYYMDEGNVYKWGTVEPTYVVNANGYRLPTITEWRYAARGGLVGKRFSFGNTISHDQANYNSTGSLSYDVSSTTGYHPDYNDGLMPYTNPTQAFTPNTYGLWGMTGNVSEWCSDKSGTSRAFCGGNYLYDASKARCGYASYSWPLSIGTVIGFRAICH